MDTLVLLLASGAARLVPARAAATATATGDELLADGAELVTAIDFWERSLVGYH